MNRILLAFFLLLCFSAHAQPEIGIKAGYNYSFLTGDDFSELGGRSGFHLGVYLIFYTSGSMQIQVGLGLSQKGATRDENIQSNTLYYDTRTESPGLNYAVLPILMRFENNEFIFALGPEFSLMDQPSSSIWTFNKNKFDVGIKILLGIEGKRLGIYADYVFGLTKVDSQRRTQFEHGVDASDARNGVFQVGLSYRLWGDF